MGMEFDSKCDFAPLPSCRGFSLPFGMGSFFFGGIQHSPVDGCSSVSCNFGVIPGEDEYTFFYSTILFSILIGMFLLFYNCKFIF